MAPYAAADPFSDYDEAQARRILPMLEAMVDKQNSNPRVRQAIRKLRSKLPAEEDI
jgi:hypothetical protein